MNYGWSQQLGQGMGALTAGAGLCWYGFLHHPVASSVARLEGDREQFHGTPQLGLQNQSRPPAQDLLALLSPRISSDAYFLLSLKTA